MKGHIKPLSLVKSSRTKKNESKLIPRIMIMNTYKNILLEKPCINIMDADINAICFALLIKKHRMSHSHPDYNLTSDSCYTGLNCTHTYSYYTCVICVDFVVYYDMLRIMFRNIKN